MDTLNFTKKSNSFPYDNNYELKSPYNPVNNNSSICMFCTNALTDTGNIELYPPNSASSSILNDFSKLFKISTKTLFQGTNFQLVSAPLQCSACTLMINGAVGMLEEIEKLQRSLDAALKILKNNLVKSYECRKISGDGTGEEAKKVAFLQKTFLQCWSGCTVELTSVDLKLKWGRTFKRAREKSIFEAKASSSGEESQLSKDTGSADLIVDVNPSSPEEMNVDITKIRRRKQRLPAARKGKRFLEKKAPSTKKVDQVQGDSKEFPFVCKTCGKGYYLKHYLNVHERSHTEGKDFACDNCSLKFYSDRSLHIHQVRAHGKRKLPKPESVHKSERGYDKNRRLDWFLCRHCQRRFDSKDFTTEDGKFRALNEDIPEFFDNFSEFRKNHFSHCREKPQEQTHCEECGKDFTSAKMLEDHRTVFHTKEFPFYCEKCGVGKISKSALNKHMLVHTNAKNFQCKICSRSFKRNVQLKFHMMRHNDDLPCMCDLCGKRFTDKQKLKRHRETHSEEKKVPCPQCDKLFVSKNYVYHHIWDAHKKARRPRTLDSDLKAATSIQEQDLPERTNDTTTVSFIGFPSSDNVDYVVPAEIAFI